MTLRKSTRLRRLQGTLRPSRERLDATYTRLMAVPPIPAELQPGARTLFVEFVEMMINAGTATNLDVPFIGLMASTQDFIDKIEQQIRQDGGPLAGGKPHVLIPALNRSRAQMRVLLREAALTPTSRNSVEQVPPEQSEEDRLLDEQLAEFMPAGVTPIDPKRRKS
jgi:hypothetical protein